MHEIELGVRDFLNMAYKTGGLSAEFTPRNRAADGISTHIAVTSKRPKGYQREVTVRHVFQWENFRLTIRGRIDGLFRGQHRTVVEEIKSTYQPLRTLDPEKNPYHLAQLRLYQYFEYHRSCAPKVVPVLTYVNPLTLEERSFQLDWDPEVSRQFFEGLAIALLKKEKDKLAWRAQRDESIAHTTFPFTLRAGQADLVHAVDEAINGQQDLLVEAATGIGKTMGVLYPAIKHLADSSGYSRIFFLTAKSAGMSVARDGIAVLRQQGLRLRVLYLLAKERICPFAGHERPDCGEGYCHYAEDFYEKANRVIPDLLANGDDLTPERILAVAKREAVCPFELSLELSLYCDLIVCDYNYAFDPAVYLRRFFWQGLPNDNLFLVDEAHNLISRSREMYSATLTVEDLTAIRDQYGGQAEGLATCIGELLGQFSRWCESIEIEGGQAIRLPELPSTVLTWIEGIIDSVGDILLDMSRGPRRNALLTFYFSLVRFNRVVAGLTQEYAAYVSVDRHQTRLRLYCLNPGPLLRPRIERSVTTVFFSATLSPMRYFEELLGARDGCRHLTLTSPFPQENHLYLHVPNVSTKYTAREVTKLSVAQVIADVATAKTGNYLAFFPSYAYLGAVWAQLKVAGLDVNIYTQKPNMRRKEQADFLHKVCATGGETSNLGLAVMGGLFAEAVDLPGEKLIGTIIVGPGLPGLSPEQELIREYFDEERSGEGLFYAYLVPGMIRVIQAAGRVFRTPNDRGVVVLLDDRFREEAYRELLPPDWGADDESFSNEEYQEALETFWNS
ncbi:MAG TPA: ATP-dependent DNA helicase [Armatimonadota bacterium]|nr:ATP-dependent DNA helicase [Armatimonadota bacterium]